MSTDQNALNHNEQASASPSTSASKQLRPLRVWPAVMLLLGMAIMPFVPQMVEDGPAMIWMVAAFGPLLCGLIVMLWWLIASRASWQERLLGLVGVSLALGATIAVADASMNGPAVMMFTIPIGIAAFAFTATLCSRMLTRRRTIIAVLMSFIGFGFSTLLRSDGVWGDFAIGLHWRWVPSPEQEMLVAKRDQMRVMLDDVVSADIDQSLANPDWPAYRGADRGGRQSGIQFNLDWQQNEPEELWRIPVGPAWSSFAVAGNLLFTQEQRGAMEAVVCYDANSGREVWVHEVESRFDDPLGGPGPRGTPTLADGGLYASGANGLVMRLDPKTGEMIWQQDLREIADRQPPMWGFSSSPLVTGSIVTVFAGGKGDKGTIAFDTQSGELAWSVPAGEHSYSSPQMGMVAGTDHVMMLTNQELSLLDPETGSERLRYDWKHQGYRSLQPHVVSGDSVLIPTGLGSGTRLIRVKNDENSWSAEEVWTSRNLKPDFNDLVIFQGHAYGFDNSIFTCIDLATGERMWKGGRYGKGQVLLLEDSAALLVISEKGELVLLKADPSEHTELAKRKVLTGKTWNHPVVVGDRLYLRNSQEAACYRLPLSGDTPTDEPINHPGNQQEA
ncbi:PQQ-binding-like beta-propeller repeat protein [Rubripirellula sp.]|nr:PQQ-binding-like beta-propeller repeat protein [Rubripirellula sp.]MDF1841780.1 PQQ-binding-like beta-propeller repeat protein [Rubripirellula sp.]